MRQEQAFVKFKDNMVCRLTERVLNFAIYTVALRSRVDAQSNKGLSKCL